jgi:hypothetical protein
VEAVNLVYGLSLPSKLKSKYGSDYQQ